LNIKKPLNCTIVKSATGRFLQQTSGYLKNIVEYLYYWIGVKIKELVSDFIEDE